MLSFQKCLSLLLDSRRDAGKLVTRQRVNRLSFRIVEFSNPEDAKRAKEELADKQVLGRPVFIREVRSFRLCRHAVTYLQDREETARFGAPPIPGKIGMATGEARNFLGPHAAMANNRNLFVGNVSRISSDQELTSQVPVQASWQDLKDLMRQAGEVIRADIGMTPDGQPKGNGTVVFVNPQDAKAAIGKLFRPARIS
jgi:hypothetical protein